MHELQNRACGAEIVDFQKINDRDNRVSSCKTVDFKSNVVYMSARVAFLYIKWLIFKRQMNTRSALVCLKC